MTALPSTLYASLPQSRSDSDLCIPSSSRSPPPSSPFQNQPTLVLTPPLPTYDNRREPTRRHSMQFGSGNVGLHPLPPLPAHVLNPNAGGGPGNARRYHERKGLPLSPLNKSLPTTPPGTSPQRLSRYVPSPLSSSATAEEDEDDPATCSESGTTTTTAVSTPMTTPGSDSDPSISYFGLQLLPRRRKSSLTDDLAKKKNRMSLPAAMGGLTASLSLSRRPSTTNVSPAANEFSASNNRLGGSSPHHSTGDFLAVPTAHRRATVYSRHSAASLNLPPQVPPKPTLPFPQHGHYQEKPLPSVSADPSENWVTSLPAPRFSRMSLPGVVMPLPATKKNREMMASRNSSTSSVNSIRSTSTATHNGFSSASDLHLPPRPPYASGSSSTLHRRSGSGGSNASSSSNDLPLPPSIPFGPYGHHGSRNSSTTSSLAIRSQSSFGSLNSGVNTPGTSYKGSLGKSTSTPEIQRIPSDDGYGPRPSTAGELSTNVSVLSNESLSTSPIDEFSAASSTLHGTESSNGHESVACSSYSHHLHPGNARTFSSHSHPPSSTLHSHELHSIAEDPSSSSSSLGIPGAQLDKSTSVRSKGSSQPHATSPTPTPTTPTPANPFPAPIKKKKSMEMGKKLKSVWRKMSDSVRDLQYQIIKAGDQTNKSGDGYSSRPTHAGASQTLPSRKSSFMNHRRKSASLSQLQLDKPLPPPGPTDVPPTPNTAPLPTVKAFEGPVRSKTVSVVIGFEKPLPNTPGRNGIGRMVSVKAPRPSSAGNNSAGTGGASVRRAVSMYGTMPRTAGRSE